MDIRKQKPQRESVLPTPLRNGEAGFKPRPVGPEASFWPLGGSASRFHPEKSETPLQSLMTNPQSKEKTSRVKIRTPILVT